MLILIAKHNADYMQKIYLIVFVLLLHACIPLKIARNIDDDIIRQGKKFKRSLSKDYAFIFEDPKDADEFYHYMNIRFNLNHQDVEYNVPFMTDDNKTFYLSFVEVEKTTKTLNVGVIFLDAALTGEDDEAMLQDHYTSRFGQWYLALFVTDVYQNDALSPLHADRRKVIEYLRKLQNEYLSTSDYYSLNFKN